MLVRARDEALGCCNGLSMAAARWRPRGRLCARRGRVARPGGLQREAKGGVGGAARRVGASARRSNGRESREGVGGGAVGGVGGEKQSREVGDGHKGRFVITKNSRDLSVNKQ